MDEHLLFLFSFLDEVEKEIADDAEKQVWIEKCINIKTLSDFTVSCSYGDMVLIICVLKDYLKLIANKEDQPGIITGISFQKWHTDYPAK